MTAPPTAALAPSGAGPAAPAPTRYARFFAPTEVRWATAALALFLVALAAQAAEGPRVVWWALYLACYAAGGWEPALAGVRALRERTLDVDLLMVAAALGAAAIGQVTDGALLIVIFATSGALEASATARTEDSVRGLLGLAPDTATLVTPDAAETTVQAADLAVGDTIVVRPGERIAADGTVTAGGSEVDQATLTGEPLPVDKNPGDEVFAGSLNGTGTLRVRVDRRAADSVVARIAELVRQAGRTKARTQLFIEKVEQRYSLGMVAATVAVFALPLALGDSPRRALLRAMTFMIVASPCAVVLATMPPLLSAIANAGRHGVLAKSAVVMEQLGATTALAFDKTGTLTRGVPELVAATPLDGSGLTADDLLRIAAAAERPSEHPLATAIVRAARERGLRLPDVADFVARPGRGVTACVAGRRVDVGSPTATLAGRDGQARAVVDTAENDGHTAVVVVCDGQPAGVLSVADQVRADAAKAVAAASRLTRTPPILLTGDNDAAAWHLARQVGIGEVRAGLLPADKVAAVAALRRRGHHVAVVGDGINDAPALAAAHSGIAMGRTGSDLARQTADAIVVRDDLTAIPAVIALSRRAHRLLVANLVIATAFIAGLVVWDLAGTLPLPLGVAGHEGSTVIVGLNGLRLLRPAAWTRAVSGRA